MADPTKPAHFDTLAIHAGQSPDPTTGAIMTPVYMTSTYVQAGPGEHKGFEYSRTHNPTRNALEGCIAALEGARHGLAYASGLAATDNLMHLLDAGDHVIAGDDMYGGTFRIFDKVWKRSGLTYSFVDLTDPEAFEKHKSARKMDPVARQILKALFEGREARANQRNKPLFRVVSDETLGEIAIRKPATREELLKIPGCTPPLVGQNGDFLLKAVQDGLAAGPLPFVRKPFNAPDQAEEERYESLRAWRRTVAEARGVEVDVIVGNATLKAIAKAVPKDVPSLAELGVLDASRLRRYGEGLIANCRRAAGS